MQANTKYRFRSERQIDPLNPKYVLLDSTTYVSLCLIPCAISPSSLCFPLSLSPCLSPHINTHSLSLCLCLSLWSLTATQLLASQHPTRPAGPRNASHTSLCRRRLRTTSHTRAHDTAHAPSVTATVTSADTVTATHGACRQQTT
jgi:hypothetical protein